MYKLLLQLDYNIRLHIHYNMFGLVYLDIFQVDSYDMMLDVD